MKSFYLFIVLLSVCGFAYAQTPANDNCNSAVNILDARGFCGQFSNVSATEQFLGNGPDVWFSFVARNFELSATVTGALQSPEIKLYTDCNGTGLIGSTSRDASSTVFKKGGLTPGATYYISVSSSTGNTAPFKLCTDNYNPTVQPGQDFSSASVLCSVSDSVQAVNVTGAGTNNHETAGTCLGSESNSAQYRWTAATSGTLVFTIIPSKFDDIDWVLYDLGLESDGIQTPSGSNAIRCAAGHGIDNKTCPGESLYTQTGLDFNESDISEASGCGQGQNGVVKYIDMVAGHVYGLIIDNFSGGNNGFKLKFTDRSGKAGTGQFVGPVAKMSMQKQNECTPQQLYTFNSTASGYSELNWYFGDGASLVSAKTLGPFTITYSTAGLKTVILQVKNDKGCSVVEEETFYVGFKPATPSITPDKAKYCLNETMVLTTPVVQNAIYSWTGPNGFTSSQRVVTIPLNNYQAVGPYVLTVTVDNCTSDPASITVPIGKTPVVNFDITENAPCTTSQSFTFTNRSSDYQKVSWNFGSGASIATSTSDQTFTITYNTPGTKTITLQEESDAGCIVTLSKTLLVSRIPPTPVIQSNKPDFCLKDTINLSTEVLPNTIYSWTGPDNFVSDQPSVSIPVTGFSVSGTYTLIITQDKCSSPPVSVNIPPILKNPTAAFRADPAIPAKLSFPVTVDFFNESTDADSYLWDFGDGFTSTDTSPSHEYTQIGDYDVKLIAFKSDVCEATITQGKIVIRAEGAIFIPNTFTPNGDGTNDEFVVSLTNLRSYHIRIFNRWGEQLFESNSLFENWKGIYNNAPLPVGTYYYVIDAIDIKRSPIKRSGSVTIIR